MPHEASTIRRLVADDALALLVLRREALESDPLVFAASVEDDRGLSLDFVRTVLADALVTHTYVVEGGLIRSMEIQKAGRGG